MFSNQIVESDAFLDMAFVTQALYIHLSMNADNDGFVNPKRVIRMIGATENELQILIEKRFILMFESGVVVIKHWWINNTKRLDRHTPTSYQNELKKLCIKENKAYSLITTVLGNGVVTLPILADSSTPVIKELAESWQPNGNQMAAEAIRSHSIAVHSIAAESMPNADKPQGFKKPLSFNKKTYAKAVRADEALAEKERNARNRPPPPISTKSVEEIFNTGGS